MKLTGSRTIGTTLVAVLVLGVFLRINDYSVHRPLWFDELMLALNIGGRSFTRLLSGLDYDQAAPILFLWSVKATTLLGGMGEYILRLVPLLGGLLLPWLAWRLGRALGGPVAGLVTATLAVVSIPLIQYSAEVKPYGIDALVTATLLWLALRVRNTPDRVAAWWQLGIGGWLGFLASIPAPFVLAGAVAFLLVEPKVRALATARKRMAVLVIAWALGILLVYGTVYRAGAANPYLHRYWSGTFLSLDAPDLLDRLDGFRVALTFPFALSFRALRMRWLLALLLGGLVLVVRRAGIPVVLLLGVPLLALTAAAVVGRYPIGGRLLLFLAPCFFGFLGVCVAELIHLARANDELAGAVGVLLVLALSARSIIPDGRDTHAKESGRDPARLILRSGSDPVYVPASAIPLWAYYSTDWHRPNRARLERYAAISRRTGPSTSNALLPLRLTAADTAAAPITGLGRVEVLGLRTGMYYRERLSFGQIVPSPGWAAQEVDRIAAVARPYVWILGAHWAMQELPVLRAELYRRGFRVVESEEEKDGAAWRIRRARSGPP
jgi:hypothetical protein